METKVPERTAITVDKTALRIEHLKPKKSPTSAIFFIGIEKGVKRNLLRSLKIFFLMVQFHGLQVK